MFDQLGDERSDLGEEDVGEDFGEGDDDEIQFVQQEQLDEVKKELAAQHTVNHKLEMMISELNTTISTFREEISPEGKFNFEKYELDWFHQETENKELMTKLKEEMIYVHESLESLKEDAHRDRKLLYTEIQNTNRRVMVTK